MIFYASNACHFFVEHLGSVTTKIFCTVWADSYFSHNLPSLEIIGDYFSSTLVACGRRYLISKLVLVVVVGLEVGVVVPHAV